MNPPDQPVRPRILYVDRDDRGGDHECRIEILENLRKDYEVDPVIHLSTKVVDIVRRAETERPYEAIITHVPPHCTDANRPDYQESLDIIRDLVCSTDAAVIAFTGAYGFYKLLDYADVVVEKSTVEKDLLALRNALTRCLGRRVRFCSPEPPNLSRRADHVFVEATVNLRKGINGLIAAVIARETKKFSGEVTLQKLPEEEIVDGKCITGMMMLVAGQGTRIEISVAGTEPASETLARRLYGILTSRSYFDLKPDRFVAP
jgi:phosphotransferase system HPr (HPr) family protein